MLGYNSNPSSFVFVFEKGFNCLYKYICKSCCFLKYFLFRNTLKLYFFIFLNLYLHQHIKII